MFNPVVGDKLHMVRCKYCKEPVLWRNRRYHAEQCRMKRNAQKLDAMNLRKREGALYAVVVTRKKGKGWGPFETHYLHAQNVKQARRDYLASEPEPRKVHIIEIGLAIGFFQNAQGQLVA